MKKNVNKLDLKRKIDLNTSDDYLPPPKLEPIYPVDEEAEGDEAGSGGETDEDDYEFEETETYTLTEWFPPDFWKSKLESAKQVSISSEARAEAGDCEDDEEYFYNLLRTKMTEAEKVVVTDVTFNNSKVSFKVKKFSKYLLVNFFNFRKFRPNSCTLHPCLIVIIIIGTCNKLTSDWKLQPHHNDIFK